MPNYKSTLISVCIIEKDVKFTQFCSKTPHISSSITLLIYIFATVIVQICTATVALYLNILSIPHFISLPLCSSLYYLSHINASSTTTHHQPAPTITTTHNPLQNLILSQNRIYPSTRKPKSSNPMAAQTHQPKPKIKSNW